MKVFYLLLAGVSLLAPQGLSAAEKTSGKIVDVQKIWGEAPHNAFTDLLYHDGKWFCVFREGEKHISPDGALRVLTSDDAKTWKSAARVTAPDADLRDAKISVAPDGRLCLCGAGAWHDRKGSSHQSFVWYSKDGTDWGEALPIGDPDYWIWRLTWHDGKAYGIGYATMKNRSTRLYVSEDGKHFTTLVPQLNNEGYVNESSLLFLPDNSALAIIRRDGEQDTTALLGVAKAPYTEWTFRSLKERVGGPQFLQLPDGRILVGGRRYPGGAKTQLWSLDPAQAKLTEIVTLPSGGDTSYPGLVYQDGFVWMSYYSTHENKKTDIYLAKIKVD
ncbi:sialidase family protein [Planctomicrobium sp. SH664]|uniref:sialidase family protein n=1 Tax=Planctomicrobium sp. SH664 TaxID=3448125 RepID=UPI003F5BE528